MKCTQYGLHGQAAIKNAKTILFFEVRQIELKVSRDGAPINLTL